MVEDPRREALRCIEFCGLGPNPRFEKHVSTVRIIDANTNALRIPPWRTNLSERQVDMLDDMLRDALARFGYSE